MNLMNMKKLILIVAAWLSVTCLCSSQNLTDSDVVYDKGKKGINLNSENIQISLLVKLLSIKERVNIISAVPLTGSVCVNLYDVSIEQVLDYVLNPAGYSYIKRNGTYIIVKTESLAPKPEPMAELCVRIFYLDYLNVGEAEKFITPLLSTEGKLVSSEKSKAGISSGDSETGGDTSASTGMIMVKDYPDNLLIVEKALDELDVRPYQVLVEATLLEVYLDDSCQLGVDFNALGGIDFADLQSTSNLFSVTDGNASGSQIENTVWAARSNGFADNNPSQGFSLGILKDKIGVFIEALENVVDTNVIANPKVLTLNRQKAEIIIGGRLGYYGTETVNQGVSQQNVEFLDTGTQLRFRPHISSDGYVRLEIHPERSNGIVDSVTGLPSLTTSEVTTNIMIKNGETVVIGGLIEEKDEMQIKRIPFLGTLPFIGWLFSWEKNSSHRTEIVVLITPHILDPAGMSKKAEEELLAFEQRQNLFRNGFLFCSRTVYAERHATKALICLNEGDTSWAEYHISQAVRLNPHSKDILAAKKRVDEASMATNPQHEPMDKYLRNLLR